MNKKYIKFQAVTIIIVILFFSGYVLSSDRIMFSPGETYAEVDDIFEINLAIDNGVVGLFAYSVHLKYDSSILEVVGANPTSEWLAISGNDFYFVGADSTEINPQTNQPNWYYHVFDVLFTNPKKTISGYAEIATVQFRAKKQGISRLYYEFYKGSDTLLNNIISSSSDGVVYVCPLSFMPGDTDDSGNVDIDDLVQMVAYAFNHGPPPMPILLAGDVNCDAIVDVDDLVLMVNFAFKGGPPPCNPCK